MASIVNIKDEKAYEIVGVSHDVCADFAEQLKIYSNIINELENKGWIGPSNVNFVNGSKEYETNLAIIKNNLEDFSNNLSDTINEVLNIFGK